MYGALHIYVCSYISLSTYDVWCLIIGIDKENVSTTNKQSCKDYPKFVHGLRRQHQTHCMNFWSFCECIN